MEAARASLSTNNNLSGLVFLTAYSGFDIKKTVKRVITEGSLHSLHFTIACRKYFESAEQRLSKVQHDGYRKLNSFLNFMSHHL